MDDLSMCPTSYAGLVAQENLNLAELSDVLRSFRKERPRILKSDEKLMREKHHLNCLKMSLQAAVTLEFATVPPYLCALWSIEDEHHPVAKSIREVVQEEMLHMALACNMLASLGGTPRINTAVPAYPTALPGNVHKGLIVKLAGLSKEALRDFLWIERPVKIDSILHRYSGTRSDDVEKLRKGVLDLPEEADDTIGEFYEEIERAFIALDPVMSPDNQITGPLAWAVIRNLENVKFAIHVITHQGEGSKNNPEESKGDLSHFWRFHEAFHELEYEWNTEKKVLEVVGGRPLPPALPMAPVPEGGYRRRDVPPEVWWHLDAFDDKFTLLIDQLQMAWVGNDRDFETDADRQNPVAKGQAALIRSYKTMFELQQHAIPLMKIPISSNGAGTYGPCFRYKQKRGNG